MTASLGRLVLHGCLALLVAGCARPQANPSTLDGPPSSLEAGAAEMFQQYGAALTTPRRELIAGFYAQNGVIRILNGVRENLSRAQLDSVYTGQWNPPDYFAWDQLQYDSLAPGLVLVTGGFLWKGKTSPDTARFLYTALVQAVDSGMVIRFEEETLRPPP